MKTKYIVVISELFLEGTGPKLLVELCQDIFAQYPNLNELVIDLAWNHHISSNSLDALITCHGLSEARGVKLHIINASQAVKKELSSAKPDKIFAIDLQPDDALEEIASSIDKVDGHIKENHNAIAKLKDSTRKNFSRLAWVVDEL